MTISRKLSGLLAACMILAAAAPAFAVEQATVASVDGLVRLHAPDGSWTSAEAGDSVRAGMSVSTGFNATAVLEIGASRVSVDPVSYLSFDEIALQGDTQDSSLDLSFGRVRSEVRSASARQTDFTVRSPVSTASVKGTDFLYDGSLLVVYEGDVSLQNQIGQSHSVRAGQRSRAYGYEGIQSVEAYFLEVADLN